MSANFNTALNHGKQFDNVKLSCMNPCSICHKAPKYLRGTTYVRDDELVEKHCKTCIDLARWQINCMAKLKEYEDINISTEEIQKTELSLQQP